MFTACFLTHLVILHAKLFIDLVDLEPKGQFLELKQGLRSVGSEKNRGDQEGKIVR